MATFHAFFTVLLFIIFIGIVIWAFNPKRKQRFDEAARLPFADDDKPAAGRKSKSGENS